MRLRDLLARCRREMAEAGLPPDPEAEILVSAATGVRRSLLALEGDREVADPSGTLSDWIARRARGEPVQYLLGAWDFFGREFLLTRDTLIPRPETEEMVEGILAAWRGRATGGFRFLDVGTGSGAIAVTLAAEIPGARGIASDTSREALRVARRNAVRHGVSDRVAFLCADADCALQAGERFDVVVSNPPYVSTTEWPFLPREVRDFEPVRALVAGPAGTEVLRALLAGSGRLLRRGGELWVEIGAGQAGVLRALPAPGLSLSEIRKDLAGRDRVGRFRKAG